MNTLEKVLYTAKAHTTGRPDGGASRTDDGRLQITEGKQNMLEVGTSGLRRFLRSAAIAFGAIDSASAQFPGTKTSFGPIRQIDAGLLNVGYAEAGLASGPAVVLLHGWPYDI